MQNFTISDADHGKTLTVVGNMTIQNASAFKDSLRALQESGTGAAINLEGLTEADLSFLQLLCSAHRTFTTFDQPFTIAGRVPEPLLKIIAAAGYQRERGCPLDSTHSCLWVGRI